MKNLKVSMKLMVSFMIVVILTALVGGVGIYGMWNINTGASSMYDEQTVPMPHMAKIIEMLQRQRACMREFIIAAATDDLELLEDAYNRVQGYRATMIGHMDYYEATIKDKAAKDLFAEGRGLYETSFMECINVIYDSAKKGVEARELYEIMARYTPHVNLIVEDFDKCMEMKIEVAHQADVDGNNLFNTLLTVIIVVLVIVVSVAMFLAFYISGLINKPLKLLSAFMKKAGSTGDITLSSEDSAAINRFSMVKDEIGQAINGSAAFVAHVTNISKGLESIANGDLTTDIKLLSGDDTMGRSMKQMLDSLNIMFTEINRASSQVTDGAGQIADGAQSLAQGSTEQAATVEQLSASMHEISAKTESNTQMAGRAAELADTIMHNAEKGNSQMNDMMSAVADINQASQNISGVIKVIDNIAFQTNILALNASVEAARAGQHGRGFAVVAEEVRNLAAKSAEAAKDTGDLISNSIDKAELGTRIAGETAASLSEIVSGINESNQLISEIARSSEEQHGAIKQINEAIDQVTQVVQQNSATSEESAAASEELSGQAAMLKEEISKFKLKSDNTIYKANEATIRQYSNTDETGFSYSSGDLGKY